MKPIILVMYNFETNSNRRFSNVSSLYRYACQCIQHRWLHHKGRLLVCHINGNICAPYPDAIKCYFRHSDILLLVILSIVMVILYLVLIAVTIPATIAISARRLHDSGISGWWQLVYFIPGIGPLWLFILLCSSSQLENNPYRQES